MVIWLIASAAFALYVANFGSYDKTYGTLGGVVTMLVWVWISNLALLFGMELNAERERSRELEAGVPRAEQRDPARAAVRTRRRAHDLARSGSGLLRPCASGKEREARAVQLARRRA